MCTIYWFDASQYHIVTAKELQLEMHKASLLAERSAQDLRKRCENSKIPIETNKNAKSQSKGMPDSKKV